MSRCYVVVDVTHGNHDRVVVTMPARRPVPVFAAVTVTRQGNVVPWATTGRKRVRNRPIYGLALRNIVGKDARELEAQWATDAVARDAQLEEELR